ncbi:MAG TPA: hypothetical protein VN933_14145 [Candidatus Eremiobacteraceae bacterium]|jgi:hypothetical protein|nr:hypothetical protein [Candidatus Eremiobacteraceae bacterium]
MSIRRFAVVWLMVIAAAAGALSAVSAGKTLTNDPLTGLPIPPSEDKFNLGNEPMVMDPSQMCKSTMKSDFYTPNGLKMNATAAWYESKLPGFKKVEGWHNSTSIVFYKPDGTAAVALTGMPAPQGQDSGVHGIVYSQFTPALPEKAFAGFATGNVDCR